MAPWSVLDALEIVVSSHDETTAVAQMLDRITVTARDTIPRTEYASVLVWYIDGDLKSFAATDPVIAVADRLQCEAREGPCVDAVLHGSVVSAADLSTDARWPSYGPLVGGHGIRSQLAMRIHDGRRARVGLNLYSRDRGAFRHPLEAAGVLQEYASGLLTSLGDVRRIRSAVHANAEHLGEPRTARPLHLLPLRAAHGRSRYGKPAADRDEGGQPAQRAGNG
jgi:hypothetical protein